VILRRIAAAILLSIVCATPAAAQRPAVDTVVQSAAEYVQRFVTQFTSVVAAEQYVQRVESTNFNSVTLARRDLKADFLLVKIGTGALWMPFRDVVEVDGRPLPDHGDRLVNLFSERPGEAAEKGAAITKESYRYNIGAERNVNNPFLSLALLQSMYRSRFSYQLAGSETVAGTRVWVVRYKENARPTLIRGPSGWNVPAHGRYWIDQSTGTVLRTELILDESDSSTSVLTTFGLDERFGVAVPVRMEETYASDSGPRTTAVATYGRFRRFQVATDEEIKSLPVRP
jgi:hypothetical protein